MEEITATLESTVFKCNGFVIGKFHDVSDSFAGGNLFSAKGAMIRPEIGMKYKLTGSWEQNQKFGPTLVWVKYEIVKPETDESVIKYLKSLLKGVISDTVIKNIVTVYKKDAVSMIRERPKAIVLQEQVKGAKEDKLLEASKILTSFENIEKILLELNKRLNLKGLPKNIAMKIYEKWGEDSLAIIDNNPYRLTDFRGIGFLRADSIALNMGFDVDSIHRKKSALLYVMQQNESMNGCTIIECSVLILRTLDLISDIKTGLEEAVIELIKESEIVTINGKFYQLWSTERDEKRIAYKLIRISN